MALLVEQRIVHLWDRTHRNPCQDENAAFAQDAKRMWDKRASGSKDYGRMERLRRRVLRHTHPDRAKLLREIAMCLRSCKHVRFAAFMAGKLEHQMRRSAESIEPETRVGVSAAQTIRTIADHTRAKQRSRILVRKILGNRMRKIFANHGMLTIASIDVVSGELRVIAEILKPVAAVATNAISRVQPGNAHAISLLYDSDVWADGIHNSDDLVTRNDGKFRQREVSLHNVQIRVADSAAAYLHANFSRTRDGKRDVLYG